MNNLSEPNEDVCYYCGRSENDLKEFLDEKLKVLEKEIETFQDEIVEENDIIRKDLSEIIESTKGNKHLALTVRTIKSDFNVFKEMIPHLQELMGYSDYFSSRNDIRDINLNVVRSGLIEILDGEDLDEFYQTFSKDRRATSERKYNLKKLKTKEKDLKIFSTELSENNIQDLFTVNICGICQNIYDHIEKYF